MLDCGCDICTAYHAHRKKVNRENVKAREKIRAKTPERLAYQAARIRTIYRRARRARNAV